MREAAVVQAGRWESSAPNGGHMHRCAYGHTVSSVKPYSTELSCRYVFHSVLNQTAKCCVLKEGQLS